MGSRVKGFVYLWLLFFILVIVGIGVVIGPRLLRQYRFSQYGEPPRAGQENPFVSGSEELKNCIKEVIGQNAFNDIAQDKRPPTKEEMGKLEVCWASQHSGTNLFTEASEETKECIRQAIGQAAFEEIAARKRAPTTKEEEAMRNCFDKERF